MGDPSVVINMEHNWWGTTDPAAIEDKITHLVDDPARPLVDFEPFLTQPPLVADLTPRSLAVAAEHLPLRAGSVVEVRYEVANDSPGLDAPETRTYFSLNTDSELLGSVPLAVATTGPISAEGSTGQLTVALQLPGVDDPIWSLGLPETYTIAIRVDALSEVDEWSEGNNLASFAAEVTAPLPGDFNNDGIYDETDLDAAVAAIASGSSESEFDLTGDTLVDLADRDAWLVLAGAANLGSGKVYLLGDANLDGVVDVSDFNRWNENKFTAVAAWSSGDFNADGLVDVSDFNLWNSNKFLASAAIAGLPDAGGSDPSASSRAPAMIAVDRCMGRSEIRSRVSHPFSPTHACSGFTRRWDSAAASQRYVSAGESNDADHDLEVDRVFALWRL